MDTLQLAPTMIHMLATTGPALAAAATAEQSAP
jgi:hypothetical protein